MAIKRIREGGRKQRTETSATATATATAPAQEIMQFSLSLILACRIVSRSDNSNCLGEYFSAIQCIVADPGNRIAKVSIVVKM